jgi:Ca-activated chloride channel family protein
MKQILFLTLILNITLLSAMSKKADEQLLDDWEYNSTMVLENSKRLPTGMGRTLSNYPMTMSAPKAYRSPKKIGMAVGGAKDTKNFKANIDNGYLPKLDSITYEGEFYKHYFDTGLKGDECKDLFCPSYATAKRRNPFSDEKELFLSVGLNSGIEEKEFKRKKLNLVVVLDISGSMNSKFNAYYYDKLGNKIESNENSTKQKMQIANESIVAMLGHLNNDDRVGVVLFDHNAYKAKPLNLVGESNKLAIRKHILELKARGGTNWSAGYKEALKLFDEVKESSDYENRIIFLTDAMPNRGELNKDKLFGMAKEASLKGIHTTFIGVGVDFNNDLVEYVSKTKGANYFSVHSSKAFSKLLDKEFDYMVTPLVYDLELKLNNSIYSIEAVYGSPDASLATGTLMSINTLFPSHNDGTATKGGVVLLKLKEHPAVAKSADVFLEVSYKDVNGKAYTSKQKVAFKKKDVYYDNSGIRKAILISDYVSLMKNWLIDSRAGCNDKVKWVMESPTALMKRCLVYPPKHPLYPVVSTWERKSCALQVSEGYKKLFQTFKKVYLKEQAVLKDASLSQELNLLDTLLEQKSSDIKEENARIKDDWQFKQ